MFTHCSVELINIYNDQQIIENIVFVWILWQEFAFKKFVKIR